MEKKKSNTKKQQVLVHKRKLTGIVVSNSMINTVVVKVTTKKIHPIYKKVIKTWKKYKAETAGIQYEVGEVVTIQEARKMSKDKKWLVLSK